MKACAIAVSAASSGRLRWRQAQQLARIFLKDSSLLIGREMGHGGHNVDRLFIGDRKAVVAAHEDSIAADLTDQKVQHRGAVANGVVMKAAKVGLG